MKPFNLEAALAGAPVVTRDGRKVTQLVKFDCTDTYVLYGVVTDTVHLWTVDGRFNMSCEKNGHDLFMATVKKTGLAVSYRYKDEDARMSTTIFETEEQAKEFFMDCESYRLHKIEWEE